MMNEKCKRKRKSPRQFRPTYRFIKRVLIMFYMYILYYVLVQGYIVPILNMP